MTYGTPCHVIGLFVLWYHHVTYRMPCHASGHVVIYSECYGFERVFFTLRRFLPYTPSCWFQGLPGDGSSTSKLAGLHAGLRNSPGLTICLNRNNPQKRYSGRYYLRVTAGRLIKNLPFARFELFPQWLSCSEASCFIRSAKAMRFELN